MPRKWTPEQRRAQAEKIRQQKPWLKSTGPRSAAGKAISRQNSLKDGGFTKERREEILLIRHFLRVQRRFLRRIVAEMHLPGPTSWRRRRKRAIFKKTN